MSRSLQKIVFFLTLNLIGLPAKATSCYSGQAAVFFNFVNSLQVPVLMQFTQAGECVTNLQGSQSLGSVQVLPGQSLGQTLVNNNVTNDISPQYGLPMVASQAGAPCQVIAQASWQDKGKWVFSCLLVSAYCPTSSYSSSISQCNNSTTSSSSCATVSIQRSNTYWQTSSNFNCQSVF